MKQFISHFLASVPYVVVFALFWLVPALHPFALSNALLQTLLFLPVVIIPAIKTGRMSYVDIGWPTGAIKPTFSEEGPSHCRR